MADNEGVRCIRTVCGETVAKDSIPPDRLNDGSFREILRELFEDRDVQMELCEIDCDHVPPPSTTVAYYTVAASAGSHGTISPGGMSTAPAGGSITFTLSPDAGYELERLTVNGVDVTVTGNTFVMNNVQQDAVVFAMWRAIVTTGTTEVVGTTETTGTTEMPTEEPTTTVLETTTVTAGTTETTGMTEAPTEEPTTSVPASTTTETTEAGTSTTTETVGTTETTGTTEAPTEEPTTEIPTTSISTETTETTETTEVVGTTETTGTTEMPTEEPTTTVLDSTTTETTGTTTGEPDDGTTTIRIFWSVAMSRVCQRNDCGEGFVGQEVTYALEEGAEYSLLSQADADAGAVANLDENCQANANKNGGCLPLYYNTEITGACTRDNCEAGYEGAPVPYAVPAGMFQSVVSQADAQAQAQAYYEANCQANANANGECFLIEVGNDQQCGSAQKNNCGSCQYGNTVQLCVGANTYFAATKAEANQLALNYINANKQAYANSHGTCSNIDDSDWVATGIAKCSSNSATADGTGSNRYKEEVDNGSCSSTSGQTRWVSDGQCPATTTTTTQIPCTYGINFGADADECGTPHILGSGGSVSGSTWLNKCSTISSCSSNSSWLSVSCSGGGVTVSASANPSSDKRYGTVNIAWADGFSGNYSVTQEPNGVEIRSGC